MAVDTLVAEISHEAGFALGVETTLLGCCCVCGLLRDETDPSHVPTGWITQRKYRKRHGVNPDDRLLTHGYCPECFTLVRDRIRAA